MGKVFPEIDERLARWIRAQALFFVGTAPLAGDGHVNVSPKGPIEALQILDPHTVAYLDMVGSGAETIAHLRENGRIVIMLCAFAGPPRILRLHGTGRVVMAADAEFAALLERCEFPEAAVPAARRSVVVVEIERIADSCGYGVPEMTFERLRPHLDAWAAKGVSANDEGLIEYQREKNSLSIDGMPAVELPAVELAEGT